VSPCEADSRQFPNEAARPAIHIVLPNQISPEVCPQRQVDYSLQPASGAEPRITASLKQKLPPLRAAVALKTI
jgi:hypothetical protein